MPDRYERGYGARFFIRIHTSPSAESGSDKTADIGPGEVRLKT